MFDTLMVFLYEFFEKVDFEKKISWQQKSMKIFPVGRVKQKNKSVFDLHFGWPNKLI